MSRLPLDEVALSEFARQIQLVGGHVLEGLQVSKRSGVGVEYHSTSPYTQGDDLRSLDWKRLASSERLFVQKFEKEEKANWNILYDYSASMGYGRKQAYAQKFCGSLCFLADAFNDRWQLNALENATLIEAFSFLIRPSLPFDLKFLESIEASSKSILILVSDFFFEVDAMEILRKLDDSIRIFFIQILDERELNFPFENVIQFRDLESSQKLTLDTKLIKKRYLNALTDHQSKIRGLIPGANFLQLSADPSRVELDLLSFFEAM